MTVRDARPTDRDVIVAFNLALADETEDLTLDAEVVSRGVERALDSPERLRYWVAEIDGKVVGQAAVSREWSDWRCGWIWWFQSVFVSADVRGLGVFRALHARIRDIAKADAEVVGLRLYVEHENEKAQQTYRALGMSPGGYLVFEELWPDRFWEPEAPA